MASLLLFSDSECQVLAETLQTPTTCSAPFYISCAASWLQILDCPVREEGFLAIQMQSDASRSCRPVYGQIGGNVKYFVNQNCVGNELSVGVVPGTSTANTTVTIGVNESVATDTVLPAESKSSLSPPAVIGISIAAVIFTILVTAIIVVFLKKVICIA